MGKKENIIQWHVYVEIQPVALYGNTKLINIERQGKTELSQCWQSTLRLSLKGRLEGLCS